MEFAIMVNMQDRWVPYFLAMLSRMQHDGSIGHSEVVGFFADGDGDFRPEFIPSIMVDELPEPQTWAEASIIIYDAG